MKASSEQALVAALRAVAEAADPLAEVVANPLFPRAEPKAVAVWALNKGFELTAEQVSTLAGSLDLILFALMPAASEARH